MKYYRVKWGYGRDDFYSVDETELSKAIRAQVNGTVVAFNEGTISGNNIIAILPDLNRLKGYNRDYQLTGEDYEEIGTKAVEEHRLFLEETKLQIAGKAPERPKEISAGVKRIAQSHKL